VFSPRPASSTELLTFACSDVARHIPEHCRHRTGRLHQRRGPVRCGKSIIPEFACRSTGLAGVRTPSSMRA
jgi:hypothetical protein